MQPMPSADKAGEDELEIAAVRELQGAAENQEAARRGPIPNPVALGRSNALTWKSQAICKGENIEKWSTHSPEGGDKHNPKKAKEHWERENQRARLQCAACPVKLECGEDAILTLAQGVIQGGYALPSMDQSRRRLESVRGRIRDDLGMHGIIGCMNCYRPIAVEGGNNISRTLCPVCRENARRRAEERSSMEKEMAIAMRRRKELGALRENDHRQAGF